MSNPLYNRFASGNQRRLPDAQPERESFRVPAHQVTGAGSGPSDSDGRIFSPCVPSYRPERGPAGINDDLEKAVSAHVSRAREEAGFSSKLTHQPLDQGGPRSDFPSSGPGKTSVSHIGGNSQPSSSGGSSGQFSSYTLPISTESSGFYSSPASASYAAGGSSGFSFFGGGRGDTQTIPGLGDYDFPAQDEPEVPPEPTPPKYTSEFAASILQQFGLEKEDLENLVSYPEDEITPANLPFILRQIRLQKAKKTPRAECKPLSEPPPLSSIRGSALRGSSQRECLSDTPPPFQKPSKIIDYGHTSKYTGSIGDDLGGNSGTKDNRDASGSLPMRNFDGGGRGQELRQKAGGGGGGGVALVSCLKQTSLSAYGSALSSSAPPVKDPPERPRPRSNPTPQTGRSSFSLPAKDTDARGVASGVPKSFFSKDLETDRQPGQERQESPSLFRGVNPSRPGLMVLGSNTSSSSKSYSVPAGQHSRELPSQQGMTSETRKQKAEETQNPQPSKTQQRPSASPTPTEQPSWSAAFSAGQQFLPAPAAFQIPGLFCSVGSPPAIPCAVPVPQHQPLLPLPVSPTAAMVQDYTAATPKVFPHTCSLCNKECTLMKEWIAHQNSAVHLQNCRLLRQRYPQWDAVTCASSDEGITPGPRGPAPQHRPWHRSRSASRSPSPRRRRGSGSRRERWRSRSRSPHSSRHARRSPSDSSNSSEFGRRNHERTSSTRRSQQRPYSPPRGRDDPSPPRRSRERPSSPSGSSLPRNQDRRSYVARGRERCSPSRRSPGSLSSSRRSRGTPDSARSCSEERLTKKLLKSSAAQSLSGRNNLEMVVKSLAPALLAKLTKIKTPSPSSASSAAGGRSSSSTADPSSSSSQPKRKEVKSDMITCVKKVGKSSPQTMVRLRGVVTGISHDDVLSAVKAFGKTKSIVLFRSTQEAIVCYEKEEDAQDLRNTENLSIKGCQVTVVKPASLASKQKKPLLRKKEPPGSCSPQGVSKKSLVLKTGPKLKAKKPPAAPVKAGTKLKKRPARQKDDHAVDKGAENSPVAPEDPPDPAPSETTRDDGSATAGASPGGGEGADAMEVHHQEDRADEPLLSVEAEEQSRREEVSVPEEAARTQTSVVSEGGGNGAEVSIPEEQVAKTLPLAGGEEQLHGTEVSIPEEEAAKTRRTTDSSRPEAEKIEGLGGGGEVSAISTVARQAQLSQDHMETEDQQGEVKTKESEPPTQDPEPEHQTARHTEPGEPGAGAPETMEVEGSQPPARTSPQEPDTPNIEVEPEAPAGPAMVDQDQLCAASVSSRPPLLPTPSSPAVVPLTIGEMMEKHLCLKKIVCLKRKTCFSPKLFSLGIKQVLISNLPKSVDGCYGEEDLAKALAPFGYVHSEDTMHVLPQMRIAFVTMPEVTDALELMQAGEKMRVVLRGSKTPLHVGILSSMVTATPFGLYKFLMKLMDRRLLNNGSKIVCVKKIDPHQVSQLRQTLRKLVDLWNFLPLLNKVFVEFQTPLDADRLGVWCSLLRRPPGYQLHRLKVPQSMCTASLPRFPEKVVVDGGDIFPGAAVPATQHGVPPGSVAPFWLSMASAPYLFPTVSPWFIIPKFQTAQSSSDIKAVELCKTRLPTVMLTGFPSRPYQHRDVARLAWPHLSRRDLHSSYYSVTVLPLQRRAFVHFQDWTSCCAFVRSQEVSPLRVGRCNLHTHFVQEDVHPGATEESMFTSLMKLSNARVSAPECLQERLVSVEVSETDVDAIRRILEAVASVAAFASFLPLANRICIEMLDSSGAARLVETYNQDPPGKLKENLDRNKVLRVDSVKSLNQRLCDTREVSMSADPGPGDAAGAPRDEEDFTDDKVPPAAFLFADEEFNLEDFVTLDEVGDGVEEAEPLSSSRGSSCSKRSPPSRSSSVPSKKTRRSPPARDLREDLPDPTEEEEEDFESFQILDSFEQADECNQEAPGAEEDLRPPDGVPSEEMLEMGSFQVIDSVTEDQAAAGQREPEEKIKEEAQDKENIGDGGKRRPEEEGGGLRTSEGQTLPGDGEDKGPSNDPGSDVKETFEILGEDQSPGLRRSSETSRLEPPPEEDEDTHRVLRAETDQKISEDREATSVKDEEPPRRPGATTRASRCGEKKPEKVLRRGGRTKEDSTASAPPQKKEKDDVAVQGEAGPDARSTRRRSSRGKPGVSRAPEELLKDQVSYQVLDSVDEEAKDQRSVTTRSTRGRRTRVSAAPEETISARRRPPTTALQDGSTSKKVEKLPEEEEPASARRKGRKGRAREVKKNAEDTTEEGEATYQILDSLEEEVVQDQDQEPPDGEKKDDASPLYQIVDSLEDEDPEPAEVSTSGTCEEPGPVREEPAAKSQRKISQGDTRTSSGAAEDSLEQVSEEEEGFSNDTPEEEHLRSPGGEQEVQAGGEDQRRPRTGGDLLETSQHTSDLSDRDLTEEDMVTLDEIVDEEEEQEEEKPRPPMSAAGDQLDSSAHLEHHDHPESMNFVIVDEVGPQEEEETSSKRTRSKAGRKSTAGKKLPSGEPGPAQAPSDAPLEKAEGVSKRRSDLVGPEAKRARSRSPSTSDLLPPYTPNNPLGREFVVPKSGFFCSLCSVFYLNQSTAMDVHCSSRRHYDSLQKHLRRRQQKSRASPASL